MPVWKLKFSTKVSLARLNIQGDFFVDTADEFFKQVKEDLPNLVADGVRPRWLAKQARKMAEQYHDLPSSDLMHKLGEWWNNTHSVDQQFDCSDFATLDSFALRCTELKNSDGVPIIRIVD